MSLEFVETKVFTKRVAALGLEDQLRELQLELLANPEAGATDPGTGGLRKVRMADPTRGKGKRGGARVHYLLLRHKEPFTCCTSTGRVTPIGWRTYGQEDLCRIAGVCGRGS